MRRPKIGIAIASYNNKSLLMKCLKSVYNSTYKNIFVVVLDDNSTDGSTDMIKNNFPSVFLIYGSGNYWWTRGTNEAIKQCLSHNCKYILVLNPDVIVPPNGIETLYNTAIIYPDSIIAPVVVSFSNPELIWWAGSTWKKLLDLLPIWSSTYLYKSGTKVDCLPSQIFKTSEAHGRSVLVPNYIFQKIGLYNQEMFPHYGADTDFSFKSRKAGFSILINPSIRVLLHTKNTGSFMGKDSLSFKNYVNLLTNRKNGEILLVWWKLLRNHLPFYGILPTYIFIILLNTIRFWFPRQFKH
ncbi:MAG: glycosyltransferase family 2 protein [Bacteroidetes bacterium]|nr:glycosyltransferase family 2 protein [Bacteroidota bacterium]